MNLNIKIPRHIGFILDGNGRWATRRGLPRSRGHKAGIEAVRKIVDASQELGIEIISFFAFSTENWKREKSEIDFIFELLNDYIKQNEETYLNRNIKLTTMGDISKLPQALYEKLEELKEKTKNNTSLVVNIALNYGGRSELVRAFNAMLREKKEDITENDISKYLYTADLPDPDFIIRTSGEQRISNFMLYQCAYSELYFPKIMWPSFNKRHLVKALRVYSKRNRRFGGLTKEKK